MQDDVVNAVYDLCEDPSVEVSIIPPVCHLCRPTILGQIRTEGYKAIVAVSKEDKGILKRNVDVLVQLLQCGKHKPLSPDRSSGIHALRKQMTRRRSSTSDKDWSSI